MQNHTKDVLCLHVHCHVNHNSFSEEKFCTRTRFETEAQGNWELAYYLYHSTHSKFDVAECNLGNLNFEKMMHSNYVWISLLIAAKWGVALFRKFFAPSQNPRRVVPQNTLTML